jgi:hypothetical protein
MHGYPKLVLSRTLDQADWPATTIIRDPAKLGELKGPTRKGHRASRQLGVTSQPCAVGAAG